MIRRANGQKRPNCIFSSAILWMIHTSNRDLSTSTAHKKPIWKELIRPRYTFFASSCPTANWINDGIWWGFVTTPKVKYPSDTFHADGGWWWLLTLFLWGWIIFGVFEYLSATFLCLLINILLPLYNMICLYRFRYSYIIYACGGVANSFQLFPQLITFSSKMRLANCYCSSFLFLLARD